MPAYGTYPFSKSIYPQQNTVIVGYGAIHDGPAGTTTDQFETVTAGYKSIPVCPSGAVGVHGYTQRQITWLPKWSGTPTGPTLILEGSIDEVDGDYVTVDQSTTLTQEQRTVNSNLRFFRIRVSALTGSGSLFVKITSM